MKRKLQRLALWMIPVSSSMAYDAVTSWWLKLIVVVVPCLAFYVLLDYYAGEFDASL